MTIQIHGAYTYRVNRKQNFYSAVGFLVSENTKEEEQQRQRAKTQDPIALIKDETEHVTEKHQYRGIDG